MPGIFELLILAAFVLGVGVPVGAALYFAWWKSRTKPRRGFDVSARTPPATPPDRADLQ